MLHIVGHPCHIQFVVGGRLLWRVATTLPHNSSVVVFTSVLCVVNLELGVAVGSRTLLGSDVFFVY